MNVEERGENTCEMSTSGHDTAITIMNSQQQQLSAQNWPVHSHSWVEKELLGPFVLLRNY